MSIKSIMSNVYFLYFITFMVISNIIGYMSVDRLDIVVLFIIIGLFTSRFTKNMTAILLAPLFIVNAIVVFHSKYNISKIFPENLMR